MDRVKELYNSLAGKKLEDIMHYFALAGLDETQYGELVDDFLRGDPKKLSANIWGLEGLMEGIDTRK